MQIELFKGRYSTLFSKWYDSNFKKRSKLLFLSYLPGLSFNEFIDFHTKFSSSSREIFNRKIKKTCVWLDVMRSWAFVSLVGLGRSITCNRLGDFNSRLVLIIWFFSDTTWLPSLSFLFSSTFPNSSSCRHRNYLKFARYLHVDKTFLFESGNH